MNDTPDAPAPNERSEVVDRHVPELVARAIAIARERPDLRVVALVAEADAIEAPSLRAIPAEVLRGEDGSVALIMTRDSAKDLLVAANPWLVEFLEDEGHGPRRGLPLIHAAQRGMRTTVIEYDVPESNPGSLTSFAQAEADADSFERLLKFLGVTLKVGGGLERLHLVLKELADLHRGATVLPVGTNLRKRFRELVGIHHIIKLALSVEPPRLTPFKKHFDLLNVGTPLQNDVAPRNDPSGDKTLELLIGLACERMGATAAVDDPEASKGDNPDVLADFAGTVWGFACKVMSGDAPATLFERIEDGVDQIERSPATRGLVVLSFKNRFDHAVGMPDLGVDEDGDSLLGAHRDHAPVVSALARFADERLAAMTAHATEPEVTKLFAGKKALPGVLVVSQTTAGLLLPPDVAPPGLQGAPVPARIGFLHRIPLEFPSAISASRFDLAVTNLLEALSRALHV